MADITVVGSISRTSVARIIQEGYFAAQIQLGHEMKMCHELIRRRTGRVRRVRKSAERIGGGKDLASALKGCALVRNACPNLQGKHRTEFG